MSDQYSDRWANRPFRSCSVVHPPSGPNYDPGRCRSDKIRFLENLWNAQAFYRCKDGRSVARLSMERELSGKSLVRTWFNIYERMDYLKEPKKVDMRIRVRVSVILTPSSSEQAHCSYRPFRGCGSPPVRTASPTVCYCSSPTHGGRSLSVRI